MMHKRKAVFALLIAGALMSSGCGQRDEGGDASGQLVSGTGNQSSSGGNSGTQGLGVRVISDANSISTGGTDVANITALVTDASNNAVADQAVQFSSTGGVLQGVSSVTDNNGEASAALKLPYDFQNQDIVVTVSAGTSSADVKVIAQGSRLEVTGPQTLVAGNEAELVVRLIAGNEEPIANQLISVSSSAGNSIQPVEAVTNPDGQVSILVGTENSSDTVRLSALSGTVSATHAFEVAADQLRFENDLANAELNVGQTSNISVVWTSQNIPVAGRALRFSITAGSIVGSATATTDQNGRATIAVVSNSAGPAKISVESVDTGQPKTSVDVEFVATVPSDVIIDASSSLVHTNETSTITALVVDALGNPVKHQEVDFNSVDSRGGQLNPASAITNSSGMASVTFTAGANATEIDAIEVHSTVKGTSITDSMRLTVSKRALNVTLGTSNEVVIKALGTQYAMPFIVQVADGSGTPLENAAVNLTIQPLSYYKGQMELYDKNNLTAEFVDDFTAHHWGVSANGFLECPTEDLNGNRYLDVIGAVNEDINENGSLDPQDPASLTPVDDDGEEYATLLGGSLDTDGNGSGYFELLYPASNALWARVRITARAEALGSEAEASFEVLLPLPSSEALAVNAAPANAYSPYSQASESNGDYSLHGTVTIDGQSIDVPVGCTRSF